MMTDIGFVASISKSLYPMQDIFNTAPDGTLMLKFPSESVTVPFLVPVWKTLAPITGSPDLSTTFPLMTDLCRAGNSATEEV